MRVTFALLAVIVISTDYVATNAESTSISTKTSMGMVHAIDAVLDDINDKRFLRSNRVPEDDDDMEEDSDDAEEEERLSRQALNDLLNGKITHKFALWKGKNYTADIIYKKLGVQTHSDRLWVYNAYVTYLRQN